MSEFKIQYRFLTKTYVESLGLTQDENECVEYEGRKYLLEYPQKVTYKLIGEK